jgi:hypothetical protein
MGTDFWIGMMPNWTTPAENIQIYVASPTNNTVHCDFYGGSATPIDTRSATLNAGETYTFIQNSTTLAEERQPEVVEYKAIHVYAKNPIAVSAMSHSASTTDSYLALPLPALGTEYIASTYFDDHYNSGGPMLAGEFLIVAPYDSTHVTIQDVRTPTRLTDSTASHSRGDTWTVTLQKGQTYLVQSTGLGYGDDDLTGTPITSDKPIGFISGHQRCSIPIGATSDSKDHLCEMYPPLDRWGNEYYDMPMSGRTVCGDYIRLIAGEDNVLVGENGRVVAVLGKKGDFVDRAFVSDPVVYRSVSSSGGSSNKKFLTVLMSYSEHESGDPGIGDPFSITMPARHQFQKRMFFRCPGSSAGPAFTHYATFVLLTDSVNRLRLNGKSITSYPLVGRTPIPTTNMSAIRVKIPSSSIGYLAECGEPFGAYLYGQTDVDGYGHPASMGMRLYSSADTVAPGESHDSSCGTFHVMLRDTNHLGFIDSRISEIGMITDSNDLRWSSPGHNFSLSYDRPFTPGDDFAQFTLTPIDPSKDAFAPIWTTDRAGNVAVYKYRYAAQRVAVTPQTSLVNYGHVLFGSDSCSRITLRNLGDAPLQIDTVTLSNGIVFQVGSTTSTSLKSGDSITYTVCFRPADSLLARDTLVVSTPCVPYRIALEGRGAKERVNYVSGGEASAAAMFSVSSTNTNELSATALKAFRGTIEISDVLGRRFTLQNLSAQAGERITIDLDDLSTGVYILTIRSDAGTLQSFKFAKQ